MHSQGGSRALEVFEVNPSTAGMPESISLRGGRWYGWEGKGMINHLPAIQGSSLQATIHNISCLSHKALVDPEEVDSVICSKLGQLQDVLRGYWSDLQPRLLMLM